MCFVVLIPALGENISDMRKEFQLLVSDAYLYKAQVVFARGDLVNSLHWFRLSAALDAGRS